MESQPRSTTLQSLNPTRRTSTPSETIGAQPGPSSHHRHHHHHHHTPRGGAAVSAPSTRKSTTTINLRPLLASVAHLPRHHLGSTLYSPKIELPSVTAPPESAKFGYTSTPVPIPRFDGKENCTFTIRVPRYHLDSNHREEICARRALWGTGVYTDDSDPVAAAIHSGFIRGEWSPDVDISMLDLEIKDQPQNSTELLSIGTSVSKPPGAATIPPLPPPDKDLHITLLILPALELYSPSVMYGLKSRRWGDNHDGMSFHVESIEWVDEGAAKGEERGGEARRKRLRAMIRDGRISTGGGLRAKVMEQRRQREEAGHADEGVIL